jgi:hypothetical protein
MNAFADILTSVGKRPEMWLGRGGSLELVKAFITGYQHGIQCPDKSVPFTHFTRWVAAEYRVIDGPKDGFTLIREHVGGDERLAFDEFFRLVPAYFRAVAEVGLDGIHARYGEVMSQIGEEA